MVMEFDAGQLKREIVEALKAERWEEALPKLELWCERYPDHTRSWLNRGYCLVRLDRYTEAVTALDRCLELDPDSTTAQGWRKKALAALDAAHSVAEAPAETVMAETPSQPAGGATRFVPDETAAPPTFATLSAPDQGRGWLAGTVVDGRYEVREVARGGMAVVSIAFDRELQRMVAVKTPLPSVLATRMGARASSAKPSRGSPSVFIPTSAPPTTCRRSAECRASSSSTWTAEILPIG